MGKYGIIYAKNITIFCRKFLKATAFFMKIGTSDQNRGFLSFKQKLILQKAEQAVS